MALPPYSLNMKVVLNATIKLQFFASTSLSPIFRLHSFPATQFRHSSFKPNILGFHKGFSCRATMAGSSSSLSGQAKDEISLTDKENQIFERLLQVLCHFNLQTQLRVAGGWVRDKLLGKDSSDIDIALDDMMGKEFCEKVNEYLSFAGEEIQGIAVIQWFNPDQSKHLETARMKLFGEWIDFVNLRSETYNKNSRIPTMEFGSAEQDAYRRDLTINSLFYNINKKSVEDFTGRGLSDLRSGKIVTPLPPKETFLDDPLRVLRAIRFGARFCFEMDEELKEAAASDEVRVALADKISRERIGDEIDLMIFGKHPVQAMTYIRSLQLFCVVFPLPSNSEPAALEGCDRLCIASVDAAWNLLELFGCTAFTRRCCITQPGVLTVSVGNIVCEADEFLIQTHVVVIGKHILVSGFYDVPTPDEQRRLYLYSALFYPLREIVYRDNKGKKVISLHNASESFISLIPSLTEIKTAEAGNRREKFDVTVTSKPRICAGLLLREIKSFWRVALLISTLSYPIDFDRAEVSEDKQLELGLRRNLFTTVESAIVRLGLENVWEMKPLVNGREIMTILQLKTGGPQVSEWQQKSLEWQLADPNRTSQQCLDWMRESHSKRSKLG
ncbi:hypothetical protein C5167_043985 [Papaver somniferum]|uniref:Poly A polymerase head domain-containing protein n=1 Tax=Papaver somniferum TaxID=3469 RepID=A0A4Y7L7B0_PAPSO|nr:hypothetical protein C5167_043985 [Papaver somniferum]